MTTKYDDKNFEISKWKLQLGNVQKNPYKIMNIMYTPLPLAQTEKVINYFTIRREIFFLLARTFPQPDTLNQK